MIKDNKLNDGDTIFLFFDFPYDYSFGLPLNIAEGIDLIARPYEHELYQIENEDKLQPFRYVCPLSSVKVGFPLACIRISKEWGEDLAIAEVFGHLMLAFRLVKPLRIGLSGSFVYREKENDKCYNPLLYWSATVINAGESSHIQVMSQHAYTKDDLIKVAKLLKKIRGIKRRSSKLRRLAMGLESFSQITNGKSTSYSMIYQELFVCLGYLFGSAKSASLGTFVKNFLIGRVANAKEIGEWVSKNYVDDRNLIAHGNTDFWMSGEQFRASVSLKRYSELLYLHEIVRTCLLGLLGLNYNQLKLYNVTKNKDGSERIDIVQGLFSTDRNNPTPKLQAADLFLRDNKIWKTHPYKKISKFKSKA